MHTIDFTTALARLLRDGARRDSFRANATNTAEEFNLCTEDRAAFLTLSPSELDAQADVLLRKRLEHVKRLAPHLCTNLGDTLWQRFREYAHNQWHEHKTRDALLFCQHVARKDFELLSRTELNRLQFLTSGSTICVHFVRDLNFGSRSRSGIQILRRDRKGKFSEAWLYLAF